MGLRAAKDKKTSTEVLTTAPEVLAVGVVAMTLSEKHRRNQDSSLMNRVGRVLMSDSRLVLLATQHRSDPDLTSTKLPDRKYVRNTLMTNPCHALFRLRKGGQMTNCCRNCTANATCSSRLR